MVGVNVESEYCNDLANNVHTKQFDSSISEKNVSLRISESCKMYIKEGTENQMSIIKYSTSQSEEPDSLPNRLAAEAHSPEEIAYSDRFFIIKYPKLQLKTCTFYGSQKRYHFLHLF